MSQIVTQNPGSSEIQSPLIAGITEGLNKLSSALNLKTGTLEDVQLTAVPIDNDEKNKNRIFEANFGNRLWLSSPAPVIKKNGSEITQSGSNFTIDYIGGSVTFPVESKPSDGDIITVSATYIIADSESLNAINNTLSAVQTQSNKYKGNYDNVEALQLAYSSAQNGDYAIVFEPLAVYAWKNDGWYDTRSIEDLSNYYNKEETNNLLNQKEPKISSKGSSTSDDNYYWGGRKTWQDLFAKVRSVTLTGLSTASDSVVSATDTVLTAIGKLQSQVSKNTQKAYLSGTGAPSTSTVGSVGQRYVNTSTSDEYICEEVSGGTYTWKLQVKSVNGKTPSASGGNIQITADDVNALGKDDTAASAESANSLNGLTKEEIEQSFGGVSLVIDGSSNSADLTSAENRIDSVTVHGFTTQDGSGDQSPSNVREIKNAGNTYAKIALTGSESWSKYTDPSNGMVTYVGNGLAPGWTSGNALLGFCTEYKVGPLGGGVKAVRGPTDANPEGTVIIRDDTVSTLEAFKQKLADLRPVIAYKTTGEATGVYTGIEVKQGDDYHCAIVEINDRLHEGDTLETNAESGFDSVLVLTGDENYISSGEWKAGAVSIRGAMKDAVKITGHETVADALCSHLVAAKPLDVISKNTATPSFGQGGSAGDTLYLYLGALYNTTELAKQRIQALYDAGTPLRVYYKSAAGQKPMQRVKRTTFTKRTLVLTGSSGFTVSNTTSSDKKRMVLPTAFNDAKPGNDGIAVAFIRCSHYPVVSTDSTYLLTAGVSFGTDNKFRIYDPAHNTTAEDFNSYLDAQMAAGTPVTIEYELATPEVYADAPVEIENPQGTYTVSGEDKTAVEVFVKTVPTPEEIGALPIDGTAKSANKLASSVNIGSASFDGSQSITLEQMGATATPVLLWSGEFSDGSITVNNLTNYKFFKVRMDFTNNDTLNTQYNAYLDASLLGSLFTGGGVGVYGEGTWAILRFGCTVSGNTLTYTYGGRITPDQEAIVPRTPAKIYEIWGIA